MIPTSHIRLLASVLGVTLLLGGPLRGQPAITDVSPEAAAPGDTLVITGTGLSLATHVRFMATVGGALGSVPVIVMVSSASATEVTVVTPLVNGFVPPGAISPSSPLGTLEVRDAGGLLSNTLSFYFMEATFGFIDTTGQGTTLSTGKRAATAFTLSGGDPTSPNPTFVLTLENAIPGTVPVLVFGAPASPPTLMVGDGVAGIDFTLPYLWWGPYTVSPSGDVLLPLPIPPGLAGAGSIAVLWALIDTGTMSPAISESLRVSF